MSLYEKVLNNQEYLDVANKIDNMKYINSSKWDWEHGLGHYKRVSQYVKKILEQLECDERTIDLGMTAGLLHDIGLIKGKKSGHALESSKLFIKYVEEYITEDEKEVLKQAISDHSNGKNIQSLIGLALLLGDKLDVTYHRTINSSIQDGMNKEIQKIKNVDITIDEKNLIVEYKTDEDFNYKILKDWDKAIVIPYKVAGYLNKNYIFKINKNRIDISPFLTNL